MVYSFKMLSFYQINKTHLTDSYFQNKAGIEQLARSFIHNSKRISSTTHPCEIRNWIRFHLNLHS